jgi:hypothetical protein
MKTTPNNANSIVRKANIKSESIEKNNDFILMENGHLKGL